MSICRNLKQLLLAIALAAVAWAGAHTLARSDPADAGRLLNVAAADPKDAGDLLMAA